MKIENENTFLAALSNGINLFLGAGFSIFSKDKQGRQLPLGSQLRDELIDFFALPKTLDLNQVATVLKNTYRYDFKCYLLNRFIVNEYDLRYNAIDKLNIKTIFTTNIDDLLFKIYNKSKHYYINDVYHHGASFYNRNAIDLVTLHGNVTDDSREFIFSSTELASAFARDPDRWHFLAHSLQIRPTIFWGYSLEDAGILQSLHPSTVNDHKLADIWITVLPGTDEGTLRYFKALGFQIIEADTLELLAYVDCLKIDTVSIESSDTSTKELFPQWAIPEIDDLPVRSILDFYRGASPTWHDIYAGKLYETCNHARIRDSLNAKKNTIIVGIPGSGKSTLLMQVLKDFKFEGHKLFCDSLTSEHAELIINRLGGAKALIGVDNCAGSIDGITALLSASNIQILAGERDFIFDTISHKVPRNNVRVLDVTDIDEKDIQELIIRIPSEIRENQYGQQRLTLSNITPSIYEVIEANIKLPALSQRYRTVLKQLCKQDERLLHFLLVCSYVHSCNTPISLDMLLAFFRGNITHFSEIQEMRIKLGQLITDYVGDFDDGDQDYYSPRSRLVAEAIIKQADAKHLKTVITIFHNQVSPCRIHYFDVFKRNAYDADLMKRVFDDPQEGSQFYRKAYERDKSPYVLQQAALYLTHKRKYREAFNMIDEALVASDQRIFSIRNSHAVILFRANIETPETDGTVQSTLQQSMEILSNCYKHDKRKSYHAIKFAQQALDYDERFGRTASKDYLETALGWLTEENQNFPWHREIKRLLEVIKRRVGDSKAG